MQKKETAPQFGSHLGKQMFNVKTKDSIKNKDPQIKKNACSSF